MVGPLLETLGGGINAPERTAPLVRRNESTSDGNVVLVTSCRQPVTCCGDRRGERLRKTVVDVGSNDVKESRIWSRCDDEKFTRTCVRWCAADCIAAQTKSIRTDSYLNECTSSQKLDRTNLVSITCRKSRVPKLCCVRRDSFLVKHPVRSSPEDGSRCSDATGVGGTLRGCSLLLLMKFVLLGLLLSAVPATAVTEGLALSPHIRHFEPVFFDSSTLTSQHQRAKRDADHAVHINFHAQGRLFLLRLRRDVSVFSDDVVFEATHGVVDYDVSKTYSGVLHDDELSEVQGVITSDGLFDGHISTPLELYYLEPAHRYLDDAEFHSVMYKASDVVHPNSGDCASQQLYDLGGLHYSSDADKKVPESSSPQQQAEQLQQSFLENSPFSSPSSQGNTRKIHPKLLAISNRNRELSNRFKDSSTTDTSSFSSSSVNRLFKNSRNFDEGEKRRTMDPSSAASDGRRNNTSASNGASGGVHNYTARSTHFFQSPFIGHTRRKRSAVDPGKTTCMLYLQADHLFYERIGSEEACIESITRHVQRVNSIYKVTDFDRDGRPDDIRFMIKRIKIHNQHALSDPGYRFPNNYGVEKFLELFSEEDYDSFCLAYMFTYRDFEGGTLGLAWTGDLKNAGGVCEKNGHYRGSLKSLNTGIVTLLNYGKHVPPAVSHVTLAHEIGHNFGSPHDPEHDTTCTPGGEDGNYIMFARATSGDKLNNNKFSPCSLKKINSVLNSKARDTKGCFTMPQASICGNGVVEAGEECDCGWEEDCTDRCCFPMTTSTTPGHTPCQLRPNKICSPSQGPCCTHECTLKKGDKCRDDNGCRDTAFCNGLGPQCPPSINKPNKTICNSEFVCYRGECTGSICLAYGLESCQCRRNAGDPDTKSCELCCKLPGEDQLCRSSFDWNVYPYNIPDMYAKAGTPCDDYKGYCDVFKKCREVDPSGPLATLRKLLLSDESLASLQEWLQLHWWAVTLLLLAILVLLMAVIRVFGRRAGGWGQRKKTSRRHRKSSSAGHNKKKTVFHKNPVGGAGLYPALNASGSGGAAGGDGANHVVHPTVVRANLPFKRRVNEVKRAATKAKRAAKSTLGRPHKKGGASKRAELLANRGGEHGGKRVDPTGKREHGGAKRSEKSGGKRGDPKRATLNPLAMSPSDSELSGAEGTHMETATSLAPGGSAVQTSVVVPSTSVSTKPKQKESLSSRFSIISFKTFRPKSLSPDKYKITIIDKRRAKSNDKRSKSKSKKAPPDQRGRSPEKQKHEHETKVAAIESVDKTRRNRSPSKRATMEDDRRRPRHKAAPSRSPDKSRRQTLPTADMNQYRLKNLDKHKMPPGEGNWLIQKFLADEERIAKPIAEGSFRGSVTSMNALINGSCNGSPVLSHGRHGSSRALLPESVTASPVRGIVNEAFLSSPRGARTHSSLRVTKSVSPDDADLDFYSTSNKYRRSVSMEAYNHPPASPDKRKRPKKDEGLSLDKRRRFSSPEKNNERPVLVPRRYEFGDNLHQARASASPLSSRTGSSHSSGSSHSTSGERGGREKLSVVTATTGGSVVSIMEPTEILETASLHSSGKGLLDSGSLHSSSKGMLETASLASSSKGLPDSASLHSNGREGMDTASVHSNSKGLPETSSLHSSGRSLLETSSHHSRERISGDPAGESGPKDWV